MKKAIAVMMLLTGGMFAAPRITVGVGLGVPAPLAVVRPVCPGPGYTWVNGYWTPPVVQRLAPRVGEVHGYKEHVERFDHFRR